MGHAYHRGWTGLALGVALAVSAQANAAGTSITIRANPHRLVAPATEVFIIAVPKHSAIVPARALVGYLHKSAHRYRMTLKKAAAPGIWAGSVYASAPGTLTVRVYAKGGQLLRVQRFAVGKAKESWAPRIIIGAIFIGLALWYWRRMQSVTGTRFPSPR